MDEVDQREAGAGVERVQVAPGLFATSPVRASVRGEDYDLAVEITAVPMAPDGRAGGFVCSELTLRQRPGGVAVTSDRMRSVAVGSLLYSTNLANLDTVQTPGAGGGLLGMPRERVAELAAHPSSAETLEVVAALYRRAVVVGDPPGAEVRRFFSLTRRTAGRWIATARQRGHLSPVEGPGKAGG